MKYTYLIVQDVSDGKEFSNKELVKFSSDKRETDLFIPKIKALISEIKDQSARKKYAQSLSCILLWENDQVWSCFVDENGQIKGDNGPEEF
ncbi:MAG: hypothetical protein V4736_03645 [Bdellovibrionota bacterium]